MNKAIKEFNAKLKKIEKKQGKLFTARLKKKEKKEKALFNRFDRCRTRKCSTYFKEQNAESERFTKEQDIQCPQKNNTAFYDCSVGFYDGPEGSKLRKLSEKIKKCANTSCKADLNKLKEQKESIKELYMKHKIDHSS
jgi:hypothetical protein